MPCEFPRSIPRRCRAVVFRSWENSHLPPESLCPRRQAIPLPIPDQPGSSFDSLCKGLANAISLLDRFVAGRVASKRQRLAEVDSAVSGVNVITRVANVVATLFHDFHDVNVATSSRSGD